MASLAMLKGTPKRFDLRVIIAMVTPHVRQIDMDNSAKVSEFCEVNRHLFPNSENDSFEAVIHTSQTRSVPEILRQYPLLREPHVLTMSADELCEKLCLNGDKIVLWSAEGTE